MRFGGVYADRVLGFENLPLFGGLVMVSVFLLLHNWRCGGQLCCPLPRPNLFVLCFVISFTTPLFPSLGNLHPSIHPPLTTPRTASSCIVKTKPLFCHFARPQLCIHPTTRLDLSTLPSFQLTKASQGSGFEEEKTHPARNSELAQG